MNTTIKNTDKNEYFQTENITREAFWNLYAPGCTEHLVLHQLRESNSYIKELDFIAVSKNQIIGHILSTKAYVIDNQNHKHEVLCVGPFSVLPEFQSQGIGGRLINFSILRAREMEFSGMILFGNPDYYHRFGFRNAQEFNITTKDFQNFEPFMALELCKKGLSKISGRFFEDEAFFTKDENLISFEKQFPSDKF
ncbi:GNAT family N-acetyltransferase [Maribellus comscasis]|uniref:GNAT family N-acetyltransferase n=1 Tax=Maribellus comscasis TaxID=2681766 RepID=A0A6I6JKK0_9BACT|nr:N-acetyltransferase [Maribellus comscasis]QGY43326.1 GNAT family N-acetyltransferase [Maribellus comscasis]